MYARQFYPCVLANVCVFSTCSLCVLTVNTLIAFSPVCAQSDTDAPSSPSNGSMSPESQRDSKTPPLSNDITRFSNAFPFTPMGPPHQVYEMIESHLPDYQRACELAEAYVSYAAWLFRSVSRRQIFEELIPRFYKQAADEDAPLPTTDYRKPHDLGLLLLCFAIGALVDLNRQPSNSDGEHYCQLAQAAMCLQPVLSNPTLVTIQALHLQSIYVAMVGNEPGGQDHHMEFSWALLTLAGQLSHTVCPYRSTPISDLLLIVVVTYFPDRAP